MDIKSVSMKFSDRVTSLGKMKKACKFSVGKPDMKGPH